MSKLGRVVLGSAVASLSISLLGSPLSVAAAQHPIANAQRALPLTVPTDLHKVAASVPHEISNAKYLGNSPAAKKLTFSIVLPLQHRGDLDALIKAQNDKTSPMYRHWLKKGEFSQRFAADPQAVALVESALTASGATIERTNDTKSIITASAPVAAVQAFFHTTIGEFATANHHFYANTTAASHPAAFHNVDLGVLGLDNVQHIKPQNSGLKMSAIRGKSGKQNFRKVGPNWVSGSAGGYTATDLAKAYNYPWTHYNNTAGAGATIGIVMEADFRDSDLSTWYSNDVTPAHIPAHWPTRVAVDGGGAFDPSASIEVTLDVEQSTSLAPQANERVYEIPDLSNESIVDAYSAVVADNAADVVSSSFGGCEQGGSFDAAVDQLFAQGSAQGQSFFASSGDQASSCYPWYTTGVSMPSSDPYVTAVGGTTLLTGQSGEYGGELAWALSGGGVSGEWGTPFYQGIGGFDISQFTSISSTMRNVPDVSLNSDNDNSPDELYFNGAEGTAGGTSFASPDVAAEYAIIDSFRGRVGLAQAGIYSLAVHRGFPLHDVINGCNNVYDAGYCAAFGYDLVTGWGSFDGDALLQAYVNLLRG